MLTVHGRHYENGEPVQIHIDGERIAAIEPAWPPRGSAAWPYVAPGLFDLQINGRGGIWFGKTGITADEVLGVLNSHFRFGVTRLCPTLITNSFEGLAGGFAAIREACEREHGPTAWFPAAISKGPTSAGRTVRAVHIRVSSSGLRIGTNSRNCSRFPAAASGS